MEHKQKTITAKTLDNDTVRGQHDRSQRTAMKHNPATKGIKLKEDTNKVSQKQTITVTK